MVVRHPDRIVSMSTHLMITGCLSYTHVPWYFLTGSILLALLFRTFRNHHIYFWLACKYHVMRASCHSICKSDIIIWWRHLTTVQPQRLPLNRGYRRKRAGWTSIVQSLVFLEGSSCYWGLLGKFLHGNQLLLSPVDLNRVEGDIHCKQVEVSLWLHILHNFSHVFLRTCHLLLFGVLVLCCVGMGRFEMLW